MSRSSRTGDRSGPRPARRKRFGFGSSKPPVEDTWRRVAGELGGEVRERKKDSRLEVPHGEWVVVTDIHVQSNGESSTTYTRVRALFERRAEFRLRVTKRNPFHALAALVGYRPVPIGYGQLERALFVRADRGDIARAMLRGTGLGQSLMRDPLKLTVDRPGRRIRKAAGDSIGEVQLLRTGRIREVARVREMVQVCQLTLDELERLGVATAAPVTSVRL